MKAKRVAPALPLALAVGLACTFAIGRQAAMAAAVQKNASAKFAELSDTFVKEALVLNPSSASQAGYHKHVETKSGKTIELDAVLDDMSAEGMQKQRDFYAAWHNRFAKETPLSSLNPEDSADYRLIDDQIKLQLLEFDEIQNYKHNPTVPVELIGTAIFQPLTENYAPKEIRLGHVLSRIEQIPRLLKQVKEYQNNADPIFISTAIEENSGNIDLIENTVAREIAAGSPHKAKYDQVAPAAIAALKDYSKWLTDVLAKAPNSGNRSWRLGKDLYDRKFQLVMEADITPKSLLADAESSLQSVREDFWA